MIPLDLKGMESWVRWANIQKNGMARDIDRTWAQYGLNAYVGAPYHYVVVALLCAIPFFMILGLLCCLADDDEVLHPSANAKVR